MLESIQWGEGYVKKSDRYVETQPFLIVYTPVEYQVTRWAIIVDQTVFSMYEYMYSFKYY